MITKSKHKQGFAGKDMVMDIDGDHAFRSICAPLNETVAGSAATRLTGKATHLAYGPDRSSSNVLFLCPQHLLVDRERESVESVKTDLNRF